MAHKDKPPQEKPSAAEVGQLRAWLAKNGVPPHIANEIVKTAKTRQQIASELGAWMDRQVA